MAVFNQGLVRLKVSGIREIRRREGVGEGKKRIGEGNIQVCLDGKAQGEAPRNLRKRTPTPMTNRAANHNARAQPPTPTP